MLTVLTQRPTCASIDPLVDKQHDLQPALIGSRGTLAARSLF
jgi:hypothetical protein